MHVLLASYSVVHVTFVRDDSVSQCISSIPSGSLKLNSCLVRGIQYIAFEDVVDPSALATHFQAFEVDKCLEKTQN